MNSLNKWFEELRESEGLSFLGLFGISNESTPESYGMNFSSYFQHEFQENEYRFLCKARWPWDTNGKIVDDVEWKIVFGIRAEYTSKEFKMYKFAPWRCMREKHVTI
jgi:hypothetical protein